MIYSKQMFPGPVTEGFKGIILNIRWFRANTDKAPNERNQQYCLSFYTDLMYDETTTKQVRKQMDILIRFWLETKEKVVVCFLKALFFGHAKGVDVAHSISNVIFDEEFKFPTDHLF